MEPLNKKRAFPFDITDTMELVNDDSNEPLKKKMCPHFDIQEYIEYTRHRSNISLYDEIVQRIDTIHKIISDLHIEINKNTWRNNLDYLYKLKYIIENNIPCQIILKNI